MASFMGCVFSYPWAVIVRDMVEMWPKENGKCRFDGNYRKAAVWLWYHEMGSNAFPGFFNRYFYKTFPQLFLMTYFADVMGMFTYWSHDYMVAGGSNTWEDSFT